MFCPLRIAFTKANLTRGRARQSWNVLNLKQYRGKYNIEEKKKYY